MRWSEIILYSTLGVYLVTEFWCRPVLASLLSAAVLAVAWTAGRWATDWIACESEECPRLQAQLTEWERKKRHMRSHRRA